MLSVLPVMRAASKKHPLKEPSKTSTQSKVLTKFTKSASMLTQRMASEGRLEVALVSNRKLLLKLREATVSYNK